MIYKLYRNYNEDEVRHPTWRIHVGASTVGSDHLRWMPRWIHHGQRYKKPLKNGDLTIKHWDLIGNK